MAALKPANGGKALYLPCNRHTSNGSVIQSGDEKEPSFQAIVRAILVFVPDKKHTMYYHPFSGPMSK